MKKGINNVLKATLIAGAMTVTSVALTACDGGGDGDGDGGDTGCPADAGCPSCGTGCPTDAGCPSCAADAG